MKPINVFAAPEPSLHGRVLTVAEFQRRWKALDRPERRWIMEAALRGKSEGDPELRRLIAGYAWRELNRYPWVWTAFVAAVIVFSVVLTLGGASVAALVPGAGLPALWMFHMRRLAVALTTNLEPVNTVEPPATRT